MMGSYKKNPGMSSYISPRSVRNNEKVLSYGDVVLYQQDMLTLNPRGWLTDNIINFATHYIFKLVSDKVKKDAVIISTGVTEIIKFSSCDDDVVKELDLSPFQFIFFPVSDNKNPAIIGGGTHWTLLVYDPLKRSFFFFDCQRVRGIDDDIRYLVQQLSKIMKLGEDVPIHTPVCPQMKISGDCGLYVIEYIREILKQLGLGNYENPYIFDLTPLYISACRGYWIKTIMGLAEKLNKTND